MAEHPNEAVVRRMYEAFTAGDGEAMSQLLAPDVVWITPGDSRISGTYKGQEDVFKVFALCGEISEGTMSIELGSIKAAGANTVISDHRVTAHRHDGATLDVHETETWTVEDGRITRVDESNDNPQAMDAFFA
jgi:uncharacterized protein (TIGR02246 family)